MKILKRLFLYCSIAVAYGTIKNGSFSSYGYWIALGLLLAWFSVDTIKEIVDVIKENKYG